jgi:hypothetical protein
MIGTHLAAILGLAALCAAWVGLQLANREPGEHAGRDQGRCGSCAERDRGCDAAGAGGGSGPDV